MDPSAVKRPPWYQGDQLPRSRAIETKSIGELSGRVLDEIIQQKLNNSAFKWKDLVIFLGLSYPTLKGILQTWIRHKILLAKIPPETAATDRAIRDIIGGKQAHRCWQRYRIFIDNGGCPDTVDKADLAQLFGNRKLLIKSFLSISQIISQSAAARVLTPLSLSSGQEKAPEPLPLPAVPPTTTKA